MAFKYESLPTYCFGCGKLGHGVVDCEELSQEDKAKSEDSYPYSSALRAESKLIGRECFQFGFTSRSSIVQRNYTGSTPVHTSAIATDFWVTTKNNIPMKESFRRVGTRIWNLV